MRRPLFTILNQSRSVPTKSGPPTMQDVQVSKKITYTAFLSGTLLAIIAKRVPLQQAVYVMAIIAKRVPLKQAVYVMAIIAKRVSLKQAVYVIFFDKIKIKLPYAQSNAKDRANTVSSIKTLY